MSLCSRGPRTERSKRSCPRRNPRNITYYSDFRRSMDDKIKKYYFADYSQITV